VEGIFHLTRDPFSVGQPIAVQKPVDGKGFGLQVQVSAFTLCQVDLGINSLKLPGHPGRPVAALDKL
jgi:hypothetical protein